MYLFKGFSGQLIYMFSMSLVNIMLIRYASNPCEHSSLIHCLLKGGFP